MGGLGCGFPVGSVGNSGRFWVGADGVVVGCQRSELTIAKLRWNVWQRKGNGNGPVRVFSSKFEYCNCTYRMVTV